MEDRSRSCHEHILADLCLASLASASPPVSIHELPKKLPPRGSVKMCGPIAVVCQTHHCGRTKNPVHLGNASVLGITTSIHLLCQMAMRVYHPPPPLGVCWGGGGGGLVIGFAVSPVQLKLPYQC